MLAAGGFGFNGALSSAELYNPASGIWTPTGSMHFTRSLHRANLVGNGPVLGSGGVGDRGPRAVTETCNLRTGAWTTSGDLNHPRAEHTANVLADGRVLVVGGMDAVGSAERASRTP